MVRVTRTMASWVASISSASQFFRLCESPLRFIGEERRGNLPVIAVMFSTAVLMACGMTVANYRLNNGSCDTNHGFVEGAPTSSASQFFRLCEEERGGNLLVIAAMFSTAVLMACGMTVAYYRLNKNDSGKLSLEQWFVSHKPWVCRGRSDKLSITIFSSLRGGTRWQSPRYCSDVFNGCPNGLWNDSSKLSLEQWFV